MEHGRIIVSKAQELAAAAALVAVMFIIAVVAWVWYFNNCATVPVAEMPGACMLFKG